MRGENGLASRIERRYNFLSSLADTMEGDLSDTLGVPKSQCRESDEYPEGGCIRCLKVYCSYNPRYIEPYPAEKEPIGEQGILDFGNEV